MAGLTFKNNIQLAKLAPAGEHLLSALAVAAIEFGCDLVLTCGTEGHPPSDPHTRGAALDVRTLGHDDLLVVELVKFLRERLGGEFTVLFESPSAVTGPLTAIGPFVNPGASAPHLHLQLRRGVLSWPRSS